MAEGKVLGVTTAIGAISVVLGFFVLAFTLTALFVGSAVIVGFWLRLVLYFAGSA